MLYKNWWVHNIIAHPIMQILNALGRSFIWLGDAVHDNTLPEKRTKRTEEE
ncbi:hypothetical protein PH505_av00560 [Pseudoalteromonas distincta]|uniref:hypothetical protein n=1 Tax=Pseudoalteromonas TaxID=53246 RepID=UPI00020A0A15|nr:hypothetical protein [Pseudoalteromonas distincta]EGI73226.1 hypothetical protein PH505_av00560 [Pseudoalteromonas distincta]